MAFFAANPKNGCVLVDSERSKLENLKVQELYSKRLEMSPEISNYLLPFCRLKPGEFWNDPDGKHRVGCGDATDPKFIKKICSDFPKAKLAVHDPPYNLVFGDKKPVENFVEWCSKWVKLSHDILDLDSAFYVWLGADQNNHFRPLPQFMEMMANSEFESRSFITMRNQRGYGTQNNWMAIRQELLYYIKGNPVFNVQYTDIPKVLKGYYKTINGKMTDNIERGKSDCIRPGNVWVDIQQVFYRMEENANGCYAQKPLKAIERIISASSKESDTVIDFFAHSGTTLVACEKLNRKCITIDFNPIFAEITIRRLEHYRQSLKTGWQRGHPFEKELKKLGRRTIESVISSIPKSS